MNTLDIIQLVNSKAFHDLGNSITTLSLLCGSSQNANPQNAAIEELVARFKLLRQTFVSSESESSLYTCFNSLSQYFKGKKITMNDFSQNQDLSCEIYQIILNLVMSVGTAISYYGDIQAAINDNTCQISANGKGVVNKTFADIINNQTDGIKIATNNVQAYFTLLLIQKHQHKINCHYSNNSFEIILVW